MIYTIYSLFRKVKENIKGEGGIIPLIIFSAIIIVAVVASSPTIQGVFSSMASDFATWVDGKLTGVMT